jgi:tRNA 2-thiouridine synthesizing protein A
MTRSAHAQPQAVPDITVHMTLDALGMASPGPIPVIRKLLRTMNNGEVLRVTSDFPSCEGDLNVWALQTNNQILHIDRTVAQGFDFYILKGDPWPVNVSVDTKHAPCPTPVIKASKAMKEMRAGETLKLVTSCRAAVSEVDAWAKSMHLQLLGITEDFRGVYRFYVRK